MINYVHSRKFSDKSEIVEMIYNANLEFYNLFEKDENKIYSNLCDMINDERTEEYGSKAIILNGEKIGVISFYDSSEIYYRQIFSLNYLQSESSVNSENISLFSSHVPEIEKKSLYLARISIVKDFQGKGYSLKILKYLEDEAKIKGYNLISLHVHINNKKAISVYKKFGFKIENNKCRYLIMLKEVYCYNPKK